MFNTKAKLIMLILEMEQNRVHPIIIRHTTELIDELIKDTKWLLDHFDLNRQTNKDCDHYNKLDRKY